jgi:hypothetical protein
MSNFSGDSCDSVLILNVEATSQTDEVKRAILKSISEASYSRIQKEWGAAAKFPIKGIPISFGGDYKSFEEQRRDYLKQDVSNEERRLALSTVRQYVSDKQVESWLECKKEQARQNYGIRCYRIASDDKTVTVAFYWNPPSDGKQEGVVTGSALIGGKASDDSVPAGQAFPAGFEFSRGEILRIFKREPNEVFTLVVDVNKIYSDGVTLPKQEEDRTMLPATPLRIELRELYPVIATQDVLQDGDYLAPRGKQEHILDPTLPEGSRIVGAWWSPIDVIAGLSSFHSIQVTKYKETLIKLSLTARDGESGRMRLAIYILCTIG